MPTYLPAVEPFFFPGNSVGCLLIHGFTGTPYEMRGLGEHLAARGYSVAGPALAGHATRLEAMLPTRWHDWHASVVDAYDQLSQTGAAIFPIGLSLGGSLALHLAAHRAVAGVVAISTPFEIRHPFISFFRFLPFLLPLFPSIKKKRFANDTQDARISPQHPEYAAYPTRAAQSMLHDFFPHLRDDLRDVRAPALLIQARGDHTIPRESAEQIYARLGSRKKEIAWLECGGHLALEDYGKEEAFARILQFVQAHAKSK